MSKILPFEDCSLETKLKGKEIHERLSDLTDTESGFFKFKSTFKKRSENKFEGKITENSFEIRRIIRYKNSFLPNISGTIEEFFIGTNIHIKFRLPIFIIIFMCIWLGGVLLGLTIMFLVKAPYTMIFIPCVMLLFGVGLFTIPFKIEVRKAKELLKEILEAEEINNL